MRCLFGHRYNLGTKCCSKCGKPAEGKDLELVEAKREQLRIMDEASKSRGNSNE